MDRRINLLAQLITEDPNTNKSHLYKRAILAERRLLREAPTQAAAAPAPAAPVPAAPVPAAPAPAAAAPAPAAPAPAAQAPAAAAASGPADRATLNAAMARIKQLATMFKNIPNMVYSGLRPEYQQLLANDANSAALQKMDSNYAPIIQRMARYAKEAYPQAAQATQAAPTAAATKSITGVNARKPIANDVKVAQPLLITLQKAIPALKKIDFKDPNAAAQWYAANGGGQGIVNLLKQPANAQALAKVLLVGQIK
jgi:hypothetical protein